MLLVGSSIIEPKLLFDDVDGSALEQTPYWGLRKFGPFRKGLPKIKIAILGPASNLPRLRDLVGSLNNGTRSMPGGMPQFLRTTLEVVGEQVVENPSVEGYSKAANSLVSKYPSRDLDLVLADIPRTEEHIPFSPYYRLKAVLSANGIPSQMVTNTTFANLDWSCLNLAIAIYAKSGAIPWVLGNEIEEADMILGISMAHHISGGLNPTSTKFVGYANIFDSYGKWLFMEGSARPVLKRELSQQLEEIVRGSVVKFRSTSPRRLQKVSIHYFKRFGRDERAVVERVLSDEIGEHITTYIRIDDSHPFRAYDKQMPDYGFQRGDYFKLDARTVLISTTGPGELAKRRMGTPKPLLVNSRCIPRSDEVSIDVVAKQVYSLTKLNWGTATPLIREPVSLTFSHSLAHMVAAMSEDEWNSINATSVSQSLKGRPWFI